MNCRIAWLVELRYAAGGPPTLPGNSRAIYPGAGLDSSGLAAYGVQRSVHEAGDGGFTGHFQSLRPR
jgi:hypothetical protein